jgi:pyruvate formate lyase activating enzyme
METVPIFDIHRATTSDGPGMRTTIFFQGCPLHCQWCQNPEGINFIPQLMWEKNKCIGCLTCVQTCQKKALKVTQKSLIIDRDACTNCGECAENCPTTALHLSAKNWSTDEIVKEGLKDIRYYHQFGGGVTLSGGEAMAHPRCIKEIAKSFHDKKVNVALDTCGYAPWNEFLHVLPFVDVVLYDLKIVRLDDHKNFTGQDNTLILSNFKKLVELKKTTRPDLTIWVRTPLIPGATDSKENITAIGKILQDSSDAIERWELCNFNNLGRIKYNQLASDWQYKNTPLYTEEEGETILGYAKNAVQDTVLIVNSGLTQVQE